LATATTELGKKLDAAGQAAEQFAEAGKSAIEKSTALGETYVQVTADMQKVVASTKACETQVNAMSTQLNSLNAVYEMQLKALQDQANVYKAQVEAYKLQAEKMAGANAQVDSLAIGVKSMIETTNEALENQKAYAEGAKKLASQVADLQKVYGNMLNALN
jgi:chromosome segregation ATPase